jgi:hypothetical protein
MNFLDRVTKELEESSYVKYCHNEWDYFEKCGCAGCVQKRMEKKTDVCANWWEKQREGK